MFDDILVPTDGSENAEKALEHAIVVAKAFDATIHGVYVVNVTYAADFEGGVNTESVVTALEREGDHALEELESRCSESGVEATSELLEGRPSLRISQYANEHDSDLIIMGTHGRRGVSRVLLGSVTESVVRRSARPVLTIPAGAQAPKNSYDDVLVATDGSPDAEQAVESAIDLASAFDATVHGLYVVDATFTRNQMIEDILEAEGKKALDELEAMVVAAGLDSKTTIIGGEPHEAIVDYASDHGLDVIVLGSHGKGAIERTFLGSVSERTIRTADRPVLVTRTPERKS
jgi:nucleotide-binding universal stress UspA family protein